MIRYLTLAVGFSAMVLPVATQESFREASEPSALSDGDAAFARPDVNVDMPGPGVGNSATFETFREALAPHGEWLNDPDYGQVWRPTHIQPGWRPYYYGRWEWTDEGWLWVSDEPFGWASYHYGRWAYGSSGWIWVPGYQWAPAWVTWRYSPHYIGWAPLAPGISVYMTSYPVNYSWWSFVPCTRFVGVPVFRAAFRGGTRLVFQQTLPAPPRARLFGAAAPAWGGPARPFVEDRIGRPIPPVRLQAVGSPSALSMEVRPGVVPIYRPE
ncbi:MAG TPA: DUF6600 domain-containing protein [Anaeromyxobacteraceae bacterium]|nr:DUF6600 domain-containing protein [Anaeromyxobacteraceae bacterium]